MNIPSHAAALLFGFGAMNLGLASITGNSSSSKALKRSHGRVLSKGSPCEASDAFGAICSCKQQDSQDATGTRQLLRRAARVNENTQHLVQFPTQNLGGYLGTLGSGLAWLKRM